MSAVARNLDVVLFRWRRQHFFLQVRQARPYSQ